MAPLNFFLAYGVGCALGIIVHELGHWLFAVIVGIPIRRVRMGRGPVLFDGRVAETRVELCASLTDGGVNPYTTLEPKVFDEAVFILGGVAANAALLVILTLVPRSQVTPNWVIDSVWGVGATQLWIIFWNLVPHRLASGSRSDGALLLALLRTRRSVFASEADIAFYRESIEQYTMPGETLSLHSHSSARIAWNLRAYRRDVGPDRDEALEGLLRELSRGKLSRAEELLILDMLVTTHVVKGDGPLWDKLNALSLRALELAPEHATLRGSRGAALVEIGRLEEGRALLSPLADGPPSFDTILVTLFLARACLALGDRDEASRRLDRAKAMLCFSSHTDAARLFARVEAEFAA